MYGLKRVFFFVASVATISVKRMMIISLKDHFKERGEIETLRWSLRGLVIFSFSLLAGDVDAVVLVTQSHRSFVLGRGLRNWEKFFAMARSKQASVSLRIYERSAIIII